MFSVEQGCDSCTATQNEFTGVQYSYRQAKKDSFFGVLYFVKHDRAVNEIFGMHHLRTVPYICTSKQEQKRDSDAPFYKQEDMWFLKKDDVSDTQVQLDFINRRLGHDVKL